ncbi:hypothetical protein EVAR_103512_1 [Eumeta japonica]|uniref:Uncharacterized protein n=1 Tax=Eumeta variegata TaxID=151549 RepID=A0A4C1YXF5_EUMVA|nr:hypothetical protein EVAR_103512_1 [Eumeta japonica]
MSRIVHTPACRPAAFGEAITVVQLHSVADPVMPSSGGLLSEFQPHTTHAYGCEVVRVDVRGQGYVTNCISGPAAPPPAPLYARRTVIV